jgi:tetratricopeptide (TPR) repeat protein
LKLFVWLIALLCMAVELFAKWLCFPLTKQLKGFQFPLLGYSLQGQDFSILSYGVIAAVLSGAVAWSLTHRKYRMLCWMGAGLIWLTALPILQVACTDGPLLQELDSEWNQQQSIATFTRKALPENKRTLAADEPSVSRELPLQTVAERLSAGWYFADFGGWWALFVGFAALGFGLWGEKRATMIWTTIVGIAVLVFVCTARPTLAEVAIGRAHVAEARGEPDKAIEGYRKAIRLDGWVARMPDLYERIGAIDATFQRTNTIEYGMYHAEMASTQTDMAKSIAELSALIPRASEPLAGVLRKRTGELLVQYALTQHLRGAYGAAVNECEQALRFDPRSVIAAYHLSRGYYLIGAYQNAIDVTKTTLKRVDDPIARADFCSNLGDAYTKLNAYSEAKLAYRESYWLDYLLNHRALSALTGP